MVNIGIVVGLLLGLPLLIGGEFVITAENESLPDDSGQNWAVLVAGSNSWMNYRHQADVCHAYHILRNHGIPEDNIVVMMFDDIAYNPMNPLKGQIINAINGPDVYEGVVKDYTKEEVTPENFLNILTGNATAMKGIGSGKVIQSGPNDRVFVNLVDHGGFGVFCFPSDFLGARDLLSAILTMHRNRQFNEMVLYVEACESGSLFENVLPGDLKVYAMSASSPHDSSYACCMDPIIGNYVGDLFSVMWMEDTDNAWDINWETFEDQFVVVQKDLSGEETPMQFGDARLEQESLGNFFGNKNNWQNKPGPGLLSRFRPSSDDRSVVRSDDVAMHLLQRKIHYGKEDSSQSKRDILRLFKNRQFLRDKMEEIVFSLTFDIEKTRILMRIIEVSENREDNAGNIVDWQCYEAAYNSFHFNCFNLAQNSYALRFIRIFSELCNHGYSAEEIIATTVNVCDHPNTTGVV